MLIYVRYIFIILSISGAWRRGGVGLNPPPQEIYMVASPVKVTEQIGTVNNS